MRKDLKVSGTNALLLSVCVMNLNLFVRLRFARDEDGQDGTANQTSQQEQSEGARRMGPGPIVGQGGTEDGAERSEGEKTNAAKTFNLCAETIMRWLADACSSARRTTATSIEFFASSYINSAQRDNS